LTRAATKRALEITRQGHQYTPICDVLDERAFVNGAVGLFATGGSTTHLTPEATDGGPIGRLRDGDLIRLDAAAGTLEAFVDEAEWRERDLATADLSANENGTGRELFSAFRANVSPANAGASVVC
jgi:phosphogluconate dehydratase